VLAQGCLGDHLIFVTCHVSVRTAVGEIKDGRNISLPPRFAQILNEKPTDIFSERDVQLRGSRLRALLHFRV
jgi:hypothetical protein